MSLHTPLPLRQRALLIHSFIGEGRNRGLFKYSDKAAMAACKEGDVVIPGDEVGQVSALECGLGVFESEGGVLRASIAGIVTFENYDSSAKPHINIVSSKDTANADMVIEIGDVVVARVLRISMNFANVEILSVGDNEKLLRFPPKAVIRREDIRLTDIDSLIVHECFRPGDIVRATVISLGDARQYFLSTADVEYGVINARSEKSGERLVPASAREMLDPITSSRECRKVAKPGTAA